MDRVTAYRPMVNGLMAASVPNNDIIYISKEVFKGRPQSYYGGAK